VSELKQLIAGLIRGENSFEEVSRGLERFLAQSPGRAADAARLLRAARDAGLAHHLFVALNGQLGPARRPRTAAGAGRAAGDDAEATRLAGDDPDPTALAAGDPDPAALAGDDPDATMLAAGDPDATALAGAATGTGDPAMRRALDREPTQMGAGDGDDGFDILGDDALEAAEQAGAAATGASWPTAPPTAAPGGPVAGVDREFHEGDLLRGRFELISKLGEGGMGAVWKGKDKLKEEARDRNPFVAIKLLQGDFKAHPEAFIALQRETAKQQRLAHPNIATVYDFDRDDTTGTVFMTMEVLEGQPLDVFIRKLPADGLPEEQAMPLIVQLCNGLSYAHQAGLVHSDLKPGNCFLTREGNIKLLDFGIARASKTKGDAEGETTLFDPGQLGALTPTYATLEMFEGEDPDPRDDIYALAIMAYQLLTGKHPYGKKSAPKAKELGLVPEPVAKLGKAQNRGLARALALHREDRTPTVEAFLDSITRKKSRTGLWATGAAAVLALALAGAWGPVNRYLETQRVEELIAVLQQGGAQAIRDGLERARALGEEPFERVLADERTVATVAAFLAADDANVQPGLALIAGYPQSFQQQVKEVEAARAAIIAHYEARITADFAPAGQRYDYPGAIEDWAELDRLYPDSAQVFQLRGTLEDLKRETLAALGERYKALKEAERLVPDPQQPDIADVLEVVRAIDPEHFLLADDDLRFRFAEAAQRAIEQDRDYARARALLAASTAYAPDDPKLNGLRYDLERILTRIENEKRIAELEQRLAAAEPRLASLGDYQQVRDELLALADLSPQSALLLRLQEQLERAFGAELERLVAAGEWQRGEALLLQFARLLPIAELTRRRIALSEAQREAGFAPDLEARAPQVRERVAAVEALLAKPELTADWESRLEIPYKELIALAPLGSPQLEEVRTETARLLLGAAREARAKESFNQAREFVRKGLDFYPGLESFADEAAAIDRAEQAFLAKRAEEERRARVETLRGEFRARVEADDVQAARRTLDEIRRAGVAGDDPFLATTAPELLAGAYQRLAARQARNDDYLAAASASPATIRSSPPPRRSCSPVPTSASRRGRRATTTTWPRPGSPRRASRSIRSSTRSRARSRATAPRSPGARASCASASCSTACSRSTWRRCARAWALSRPTSPSASRPWCSASRAPAPSSFAPTPARATSTWRGSRRARASSAPCSRRPAPRSRASSPAPSSRGCVRWTSPRRARWPPSSDRSPPSARCRTSATQRSAPSSRRGRSPRCASASAAIRRRPPRCCARRRQCFPATGSSPHSTSWCRSRRSPPASPSSSRAGSPPPRAASPRRGRRTPRTPTSRRSSRGSRRAAGRPTSSTSSTWRRLPTRSGSRSRTRSAISIDRRRRRAATAATRSASRRSPSRGCATPAWPASAAGAPGSAGTRSGASAGR